MKYLLTAVAAAVALASASVLAQSSDMPRAWDGHPDLNGVWQAIGTAHWDLEDHPSGPGHPDLGAIGAIPPGQGVVEGGEIPYRPEARLWEASGAFRQSTAAACCHQPRG